jgi:two-component system, NtrC family, sensor histidine kinase HydH
MAKEPDNLGRANEELSRLTGGLAHEIKNPLSTIKVNLKLISENLDKNDPKLAGAFRKIGVIQKETDRLEHILGDFLRYIGKTELQPVIADVNEVVGDMVDFYTPQAQIHSITMRFGPFKDKLICRVDIVMLKQVLLNLFINAQQAMPAGGELIIRTYRKNDDAIIEVGDTGTGIASEMRDRIFDVFYSSKTSGSGLGLAIAKKIISGHKGSISVNSEVGKGTLFTISLPLSKLQGVNDK